MTGGMPSTAAVAASQQASDYQMSQMTDKIPELQQLAYSMYQDGLNADRADLNTLIGLEDNSYNRWLADRNYLYQLARDQVGDQQTADALAYQKQQDKLKPVCELNCSGDSYDGLHHAMQKRRAAVVLVNCCARSGRAFFNALVSKREEVTAL